MGIIAMVRRNPPWISSKVIVLSPYYLLIPLILPQGFAIIMLGLQRQHGILAYPSVWKVDTLKAGVANFNTSRAGDDSKRSRHDQSQIK